MEECIARKGLFLQRNLSCMVKLKYATCINKECNEENKWFAEKTGYI